ncbi:hypothetical protein [Sphingomonas solaris]|nr:hypothetical protein [Sphingomonas solaris]
MNKGFFALMLLVVLLLPMYAGLRRIRHLPPTRPDDPAASDKANDNED